MQSPADDFKRDPETARAVNEARARMDSLALPGRSVAPSDPRLRTQVEVSSPYGAADLSIVDGTYSLIASGVGWINASLPPGDYTVRHQLGDEEGIQAFSVAEGGGTQSVALPALPFASPIPLFGTRYFRDGSDFSSLAKAGGNFRLLIWAPTKDGPASSAGVSKARIEAELAHLKLEVFKTDGSSRPPVPLPEAKWTEQRSALVATSLEPGCYVLVQTDESGRKRCMPVWVHAGLLTCVFLLSLEVEGTRVPVDFNHAGVSLLLPDGQRGTKWIDSLYQLEAARKVLTQGRQVQGWAGQSVNAENYTKENPLLHLIDALLLFSSTGAASKDAPLEYGSCAAERFAKSFPDGQAVLVAMARLKRAELAPLPDEFRFEGPPLLRRSWEVLLRGPKGNAALGKVMNFPFTAESNGAWFLWSEEPVTRQPRTELAMNEQDIKFSELPSPPRGASAISAILVAGVNLIGSLFSKRTAKADAAPAEEGDVAPQATRPEPQGQLSTPASPLVTFDNVVSLLVALTASGILQKHLDSGREYAESKGVAIDDEVLQRLVQSLSVLKNRTLVKALTAEVLVREALVSLGLPRDKVIQLVRAALTDLMGKLSDEDLDLANQVMHPVFDTVERWLGSYVKK